MSVSAGLLADAVAILQVRPRQGPGRPGGPGRAAVVTLGARAGRRSSQGRPSSHAGWRGRSARAPPGSRRGAFSAPARAPGLSQIRTPGPAPQEEGLWRLAATLTARGLRSSERAHALQRWAAHVLRSEGGLWRAAGVLTAAGCLRGALGVLRDAGLPDCAAAFVEACRQAGLVSAAAASAEQPPPDGGGAAEGNGAAGGAGDGGGGGGGGGGGEVLYDALGGAPMGRPGARPGRAPPRGAADEGEVAAALRDFDAYCSALVAHL
jgi:hypothetical protein